MKAAQVAALSFFAATACANADTASTAALNALRADNGRAPVAYSDKLESAAARHARDMAKTQTFSHTGSDGSDVAERVTATGYRWCFVAENIARGQRTLAEVMHSWAESPGHRQNMLSGDVADFALVEAPGRIWVMVLARSGC